MHLYPADAQVFYDFLRIGDHVQVVDGPVSADDIAKTGSDNGDNGGGSHRHDGDDCHDDGGDGDPGGR